jgi:anthranilate phosphoribosyltransferase
MHGFRDGEEIDLLFEPEQVGLRTAPREAIQPVDVRSNVGDFLRIAYGVETGPKRELIAANAGAALWLTGRAASLEEGVQTALDRLASGAAGEKLTRLVELLGDPEVLRRARREHLSPDPD